MNIKLLSGKVYDYVIIVLFLFSVFFVGTFFPNDLVKEKIRQETIKHIKAIGSFYEPKIDTSDEEEEDDDDKTEKMDIVISSNTNGIKE